MHKILLIISEVYKLFSAIIVTVLIVQLLIGTNTILLKLNKNVDWLVFNNFNKTYIVGDDYIVIHMKEDKEID